MNNTIKFMYYLYDYDTGELIAEFTNKKDYIKEFNKREEAGQICFGQDTNSLLHNLSIGLYGADKMFGLTGHK